MEREGRDAAAVRLGPSERTIRRTLTDRHLSRRMTEALLKERDRRHREQPAGVDEDEQGERGEQQQQEQQEERVQTGTGTVEELAARVGVLETELKDWSGCLDHDLELLEQQLRALAGQLGLALSSQMGAKWERRLPPRIHPQLVTVEPAPDDAANYREALPLVAEWRRALADLEDPPHTLAWLRLQERLLVVEIELLDDHRLTLPPAELPWDEVRRHDELRLRRRELADVRRHDELRLRRRELADVRRQRAWTQVLHVLARIATIGLWGRAPSLERQLRQELRARQAALVGGPDGVDDGHAPEDGDSAVRGVRRGSNL